MVDAAVVGGWSVYPDAAHVLVPVALGNTASWRLLERVGFRRVAVGELEPDNPVDPRDHVVMLRERPSGSVAAVGERRPVAPGREVPRLDVGRQGLRREPPRCSARAPAPAGRPRPGPAAASAPRPARAATSAGTGRGAARPTGRARRPARTATHAWSHGPPAWLQSRSSAAVLAERPGPHAEGRGAGPGPLPSGGRRRPTPAPAGVAPAGSGSGLSAGGVVRGVDAEVVDLGQGLVPRSAPPSAPPGR